MFQDSSNQLEQTEEANGIVQTEIQSNSILLEVVNRHFQLLRVASVAETPLIGLFLYHLVTDLSRPNDMLPLVIKEFLDCYNPYPFVIGKVVYGVSIWHFLYFRLKLYHKIIIVFLDVPVRNRC